MRVIFVTRGWPTESDPMSGNFESVQAKALAKKGVDVSVIYLRKKSIAHLFASKTIYRKEYDGITVLSKTVALTEIPGWKVTKNSQLDIWLRQKAFCQIYEYYRKLKGDADLIHAHFINQACDCKMVLDKYHIPFVITEHWSKMNFATLDKGLANLGEGYKWADKVISVSAALADSLREKFGVESQVIHNMVSDSFFDSAPVKERRKDSDKVKFVSVGSLVHMKGYDLIISALQKCISLGKCQISIIGGGPEEANLRELIAQCQLQDRVFLAGKKTPEEVSELMAESDCFILASRRETFGIVYIEAMAKGKPVIATICGGPESFVNESNGLLIPAEDIEATAKAIDYMVENLDKYNNTAIRQYCHDNFSEEAISQKIIAVYYEAIEKHNRK